MVQGIAIRPFGHLSRRYAEDPIAIGVIATPAVAAQTVCDALVDVGVRSILNFAPAVLSVPDGVDVRRVDLSTELQILAFHAQQKALAQALWTRSRARPRAGRGNGFRTGGGDVSLLVIGLSHHTAPLALLESLSESPDRVADIATAVLASATASEAVVLATCNRLEVYAEVPAFHPAVAAIGEALAIAAGTRREGLPTPTARLRATPSRSSPPGEGHRRPPLRPL